MTLRAAICDDEPLALDRLSSLLARSNDVDLVGAFASGETLLNALPDCWPDLLLIDVDMPRMDGFDVIEALSSLNWPPGTSPPLVVFVTAHPRFAVAAFDSGALDFINKPVRLTRLEQSLARARVALEQKEAWQRLQDLQARLEELKHLYDSVEPVGHIWVRRPGEVIRVPLSSIQWVQAEGEYVRIHCASDSYLERASLTSLEEQLGSAGFLRIHRSTIVSFREVARMETGNWGRTFVRLQCGKQLAVGRKYRSAIQVAKRGVIDPSMAVRTNLGPRSNM